MEETPMQHDTTSRVRILVGLGAAAGAFGVAVMMSAVAAPTARADDFSDVVTNVDADYTDGASMLTAADTDFASNDFADGLASLFPVRTTTVWLRPTISSSDPPKY
jgi:hypothetical protein